MVSWHMIRDFSEAVVAQKLTYPLWLSEVRGHVIASTCNQLHQTRCREEYSLSLSLA